jgi:hypothetical protein
MCGFYFVPKGWVKAEDIRKAFDIHLKHECCKSAKGGCCTCFQFIKLLEGDKK